MTPSSDSQVDAAHRAATRALAHFRTVPREVREDLAQEAALRTWQTPAVRHPERFATLVARRLAIDWLRRRLDVPTGYVADVPEVAPWQCQIEARLVLRVVGAAIARAPRLHRETLLLLYVEEQAIEDVVAGEEGVAWARQRDLMYKRRRRAVSWLRANVPEAA